MQFKQFNKVELRRELIKKRRSAANKAEKDSAVFEQLIALPQLKKAELVLTYVSTEIEVDTRRLIDYCFENKIALAVPGIVDEKMRFFQLLNWEIGNEIFDFSNSICIVPALAYDKSNRRLGYGGGYYDRFLKDYTGYKIGLCYEEFMLDIPVEEHDEGVDIVLWS